MSQTQTNFILKLKALLHDPVHKIWLFDKGRNIQLTHEKDIDSNYKWHEKVAEDLFRFLLSESIKDDNINTADQIASGLSRIVVAPQMKEENRKNFYEESSISFENAQYIDPFKSSTEDITYPNNHEEVKNLFEIIGKLNFSNTEERAKFFFLFLWRFLPDIFPWIEKHPADSRAPNHSIYDHLVQTSAIATCIDNNDKPSFLIFTITPVQSFIATARKTSDLWAGSYLLSYLIYKAIEVIIKKLGPDHIIFPNLRCQPLVDLWFFNNFFKDIDIDIPVFKDWQSKFKNYENNNEITDALSIANFPNRFLAIIPYSRASEIAKKCEEAIEKTIDCLLNNNGLSNDINREIERSKILITQNLISYLKPYWVIVPFYKDSYTDIDTVLKEYENLIGKNKLYEVVNIIKQHPYYKNTNVGSAYSLLVELTEKFLASRKMLKDFKVIPSQTKEKCHLCGEYDILNINWTLFAQKHYVNSSERLCGVCLFKRILPELFESKLKFEIKFPSTSEMATVKFKKCLSEIGKVKEIRNKINSVFKNNLPKTFSVPKLKDNELYNIDGQWLMESSYREKYIKNEFGIEIDQKELDEMKEYLKINNINPSAYYAILAMDGDNMGKWLKGEFLPKVRDLIHPTVSNSLANYDNNLNTLLDSTHPMSPSFHNLFSRRLSEFALNEVKKIVEEDYYGKLIYAGGDDVLAFLPVEDALYCAFKLNKVFRDILGEKASMSAGIVYVHHKYPLSLALEEVRAAEKKAKATYKRNAFCIKYISGSGQSRITGMKWEEKEFFDTIISKYKVEELSSKFAYDVMEVVKELFSEQNEENISDDVISVLKNEVKRLYRHKLTKDKQDKDFEDKLINLLEKYKNNITDFADMLLIARVIAKIGG